MPTRMEGVIRTAAELLVPVRPNPHIGRFQTGLPPQAGAIAVAAEETVVMWEKIVPS